MNKTTGVSIGFAAKLTAARIVHSLPKQYRLMKKKSGELVLQGAFYWEQGTDSGFDWRDIPTEIEA